MSPEQLQQMQQQMGSMSPDMIQQAQRMAANMGPQEWEAAQKQMAGMDGNTMQQKMAEAQNLHSSRSNYVLTVRAVIPQKVDIAFATGALSVPGQLEVVKSNEHRMQGAAKHVFCMLALQADKHVGMH